MKKIALLICLALSNTAFSQEDIDVNQDENESEVLPISINISIANNTDTHVSNKTTAEQNQATLKEELEKKKQRDQQRALEYIRAAVMIAHHFLN